MLQQFPLTSITKADTLNYRIQQLQIKVDSLEKIVNKTEIGTGFFSEIISLQLAIFLFIVGVAGWISWKQIFNKINNARIKVLSETKAIIKNQENHFNQYKKDLDKKLIRNEFNVAWSIYFSLKPDNYSYRFLWAISCASAAILNKPNELAPVLDWLNNAKDHLTHVKNGEFDEEKVKDRFDYHISVLKANGNTEIIEILSTIKKRTYEVIYSEFKEEPPIY